MTLGALPVVKHDTTDGNFFGAKERNFFGICKGWFLCKRFLIFYNIKNIQKSSINVVIIKKIMNVSGKNRTKECIPLPMDYGRTVIWILSFITVESWFCSEYKKRTGGTQLIRKKGSYSLSYPSYENIINIILHSVIGVYVIQHHPNLFPFNKTINSSRFFTPIDS